MSSSLEYKCFIAKQGFYILKYLCLNWYQEVFKRNLIFSSSLLAVKIKTKLKNILSACVKGTVSRVWDGHYEVKMDTY